MVMTDFIFKVPARLSHNSHHLQVPKRYEEPFKFINNRNRRIYAGMVAGLSLQCQCSSSLIFIYCCGIYGVLVNVSVRTRLSVGGLLMELAI